MSHQIDRGRIFKLIDNRLSIKAGALLRDHLNHCASCRGYYRQVLAIRHAARISTVVSVPDWSTLDDKIERRAREMQKSPAPAWARRRILVFAAVCFVLFASAVVALSFSNLKKDFENSSLPPVDSAGSDDHPISPMRLPVIDIAPLNASVQQWSIPTDDRKDTEEKTESVESLSIHTPGIPIGALDMSRGSLKESPIRPRAGYLPLNAIRESVNPVREQVKQCYEYRLKRRPDLIVRFDVRLVVGLKGNIVSVSSVGMEDLPTLRSCVEDAFRSLTFPAPRGGSLEISVPFRLYPKQ